MPIHRNPFEKGKLYITFSIDFPPPAFLSEAGMANLEKLLPTRQPVEMPAADAEIDEVVLQDYNPHESSHRGRSGEAYDSDEDMAGGRRVQCASQ